MRLLLLGCSGFVGRELVPHLLQLGHQLTLLSRQANPFPALVGERLELLRLDPALAASWQDDRLLAALAAAEGVVNLVGEPIAERRWTPAHRQLLLDSRVNSTELLVRAMAAQGLSYGQIADATGLGTKQRVGQLIAPAA